ncbi:protein PLANT CADMIUM RESISTANCE 3-like [Mercurialis annua]|uniref:protein PLANT CADMIUM RESISTANCE 3-like n=1 Tax=Mercurialis annua TaxID=3986 RepID=UPI00215F2475|nr:protein PLANT CADMIUM RESISTANCE 3-like [Mercurialis annua]
MSSQPHDHSKTDLVPWSTGICDCSSDLRTCCMSCLCPCVIFGRVADILDKGKTSTATSGALYVILACIAGPCLVSAPYRSKLRRQYNIEGSRPRDCLVHCFCDPCALAQEYRELQNKGFNMKLGWEGNLEKQNGKAAIAPEVEIGMQR